MKSGKWGKVSSLHAESGQLVLIRHAPVATPGFLYGRTDIPAQIEAGAIAPLQAALKGVGTVVSSPALRCRETAAAIWPGKGLDLDAALWEQDFGEHDGLAFSDIPDIGETSAEELANYAPPGGESFREVCDRTHPALTNHARQAAELGETRALVVHAGVIRSAVSLAVDHVASGLGFEVANLSMTAFRTGAVGIISVQYVNKT